MLVLQASAIFIGFLSLLSWLQNPWPLSQLPNSIGKIKESWVWMGWVGFGNAMYLLTTALWGPFSNYILDLIYCYLSVSCSPIIVEGITNGRPCCLDLFACGFTIIWKWRLAADQDRTIIRRLKIPDRTYGDTPRLQGTKDARWKPSIASYQTFHFGTRHLFNELCYSTGLSRVEAHRNLSMLHCELGVITCSLFWHPWS